ncbi:neutrophil gelatinase-associated lipocalin [Salminus brasiliensis]|uniref:neutrophil gelatinase-associated lipocalin n=1 Tax=Salminus brasiliensis TaxID=930266 RepID=UPI003B82CA2C
MSPVNMKIILVTVTLAALLRDSYGNVQAQKNFDLKRFGGRWYRVGLAYDSPSFVLYKSTLRVIMGRVDPKENGDANMTVWRMKSNGCKSKLYSYMKTSVPGVFTYFSTRHNIIKDVTVVETNYTEYALLFKYKKMNREYSQVSLYGRTQKLRPELIEKFKKYALQQGFPEESIVTPPPADTCPLSAQ